MVVMSTVVIGFEADMRREEMDMRLVDIDDCEERPDAADAGEIDRGVERSEEDDVLYAYEEAMACVREKVGERSGVGKSADDSKKKKLRPTVLNHFHFGTRTRIPHAVGLRLGLVKRAGE